MALLKKFLGDDNKKLLKKWQPLVEKINSLEEDVKKLSDKDLKEQTIKLKAELKSGKTLDDILPRAFAVVREAANRSLGQRHYDVQLLAGIALHNGIVAEQKTGEGKTLSATTALYLNALGENGVHIVTVNDYLSQRDCGWMGPVYDALGLTVGVIVHQQAFIYDHEYVNEAHDDERLQHLKSVSRAEAYQADITYGTNNEFGFDYLRDNMVQSVEQMVQRGFNYSIVDEVDSILIDEARTPLIISAPDTQSSDKYKRFAQLVKNLKEDEDYNIDEKMRASTLTDEGVSKVEKSLGMGNIYTEGGIQMVHHIEQALRAEVVYQLDKDYVVKDDEVVIVDEFTGRLMPGRRFSEGLHQALEAKENVTVQRESRTLATITFQNYFRQYKKLAGMTGTADTEKEEFFKIYGLDVVVVPTNKDLVRKDMPDRVYRDEAAKMKAVVADLKDHHEKGQPVLVGTISIEKNEEMAEFLRQAGLPVEILNAKNHEREAQIIAQAGRSGAITVATNMAGRGVDIKLGGDPYDAAEEEKVKAAGGLHVVGTERHEARRIDNQLRGRSGRQGDPGSTQFYVSMDDDLMRIFGATDRVKKIMGTLKVPEDVPIEHKMVSRSLETAQKKVEGNNFDVRKHLVDYDNVVNRHRETIYKRRLDILKNKNNKDEVLDMIDGEISAVVNVHTAGEDHKAWDIKEIYEVVNTIFPLEQNFEKGLELIRDKTSVGQVDDSRKKILEYTQKLAQDAYEKLEEESDQKLGSPDALRKIEQGMMLRTIDMLWVDHLDAMQSLRTGIGLRGYGQRDPLVEYKKEALRMFQELEGLINKQVVYSIFKVGDAQALAPDIMQAGNIQMSAPAKTMKSGTPGPLSVASAPGGQAGNQAASEVGADQAKEVASREIKSNVDDSQTHFDGQRVGRNDACPCGSGKKFKKCHGA